MMAILLGIDQGTTGTTAVLIDENLEILAKHTSDFPQYFPQTGWVEHNLDEIWSSTIDAIQKVLTKSKIDPKQIDGIGITNQRETIGLWEGFEAKPLHPAIVWQCRRTADFCNTLKKHEPMIQKKTGLVVDAYFSASKLRWLTQNVKVPSANTYAGTIETYLVFKLTKGNTFVTDVSNASRTQLFNLETLDWDDELLKLFEINKDLLAPIVSNAEIVGHTQGLTFLPDGIPIAGLAGDQQSALFGQACVEKGSSKCTYGTGGFVLVNTGSEIKPSNHRMLTTVAWQIKNQTTYALEGSTFVAGSLIQWLRDGLGIIEQSSDVEDLALTVADNGGVVIVPALTGLGAPYWNPEARGLISGISRGTTKAHIARASLEAIAFQIQDVLACMETDLGQRLQELRVDGGACENNLLMQMQADLSNLTIVRPKMVETTSLGCSLLAGLSLGVWNTVEDIQKTYPLEKTFTPKISDSLRREKRILWEKAVSRVQL